MSYIPRKSDGPQRSPNPASSRGVSPRPVMERTRLFTSHLDSIIKSKDKPRGNGSGGTSPNVGPIMEGEVKYSPVKCEPSNSPRQLDFHPQDRDAGLEGDDGEDLQETPVVKKEGFTETIVVAVTTSKQFVSDLSSIPSGNLTDGIHCAEDEDGGDPVAQHIPKCSDYNSSENDESNYSVHVKVSMKSEEKTEDFEITPLEKRTNEFPKKVTSYSGHSVKNELIKSKSNSINLNCSTLSSKSKSKAKKKSRCKGSKASPTKNLQEDFLRVQSRNSPSTSTASRDSCKRSRYSSNSGSHSMHQTSDSSKRKLKWSSSSRDNQHEERERSRSHQRKRSTSCQERTTPNVQASPQERTTPNVQASPHLQEETPKLVKSFVPHYKQRSIQLERNSHEADADLCHQTPIKSKNCKSTHTGWQQLSGLKTQSKVSSSEIYVDDAVCSASNNEIIAIPLQDKMGSCSSLSSQSDSAHSIFNRAPADFSSPFVHLRPEYQILGNPSPLSSSCSSLSSDRISGHSVPIQFPPNFTTPPPPPPMYQGIFQWSNVETPSPSPLQRSPASPCPRLLFSPSPNMDRRFQCLQNLHDPPKPSFHGYQLIGDSMLLRFSQQILGESSNFAESLRFLGYCVSGQKIGELLRRLKSGFYHLGKQIVLMIGTNDLLRNTHVDQMCQELRRVVDHLRTVAKEIVVLTLPPVPRLENDTCHWLRLNTYNNYIKGLDKKDSGISVFDLSPLYTLTQEELEEQEMLDQFNAVAPFCRGCLTCMDDGDDFGWDSSQSDEDDIDETALLTRVLINTSPITVVDTGNIFVNKRIHKCRLDCYEILFSESGRKDLIHLNLKGLNVVKEELFKVL